MICQTRSYLTTVPTARDYTEAFRQASATLEDVKSNLKHLYENYRALRLR